MERENLRLHFSKNIKSKVQKLAQNLYGSVHNPSTDILDCFITTLFIRFFAALFNNLIENIKVYLISFFTLVILIFKKEMQLPSKAVLR